MNATITVEKLTDISLLRRACAVTMGAESSKARLETFYNCERSPIRTQMFWIEMKGIPSFVSVHLVRHKIGVEHLSRAFVTTVAARAAKPASRPSTTPCSSTPPRSSKWRASVYVAKPMFKPKK